MKQTYHIDGIKCTSCIKKITDALTHNFPDAIINIIDNKELIINSNEKIAASILNKLLHQVGPYTLKPLENNEEHITKPSYKPIFLIFAYIITANSIINIRDQNTYLFMSHFMASFFLVFSFFKLLDLHGFAQSYCNYDLIAKKFYRYGYIYPFIECFFGLGYLLSPFSFYLNLIVFLVMLISTAGVIQAKLKKRNFRCACVGTFLNVPLSSVAIIEDILMVFMSLIMLTNIMG